MSTPARRRAARFRNQPRFPAFVQSARSPRTWQFLKRGKPAGRKPLTRALNGRHTGVHLLGNLFIAQARGRFEENPRSDQLARPLGATPQHLFQTLVLYRG
jgi:hypothetical protein